MASAGNPFGDGHASERAEAVEDSGNGRPLLRLRVGTELQVYGINSMNSNRSKLIN
jgi:hypothetical protein